MKKQEKVGLIQVLELIKSGSSPAQISKKYNIPKQNISYFVGKLKKLGCIEKKGYGVWKYLKPIKEVKSLTTTHSNRKGLTSPKKEIRGHAFIWKIEFYKPYDWKKIVRSYKKKKLTFQLIASGKVFRIIFKSRKIWLNKRGLTIYEPIDFVGISSFQVKSKAVFEMDKLIKDLLKELGVKFRPYRFTTSREHYGIIKHELARQFNEKKEKMNIRSDDGDVWMWIDDSKGLGELENNEVSVNRQVQNYWNDHRKHNFAVTPTFVLNTMQGIQDNQMIFDRNMQSHLQVLNKIGDAIEKLNKRLKDERKI